MTELNNAVTVITGAAGGFGRELTRQLLQAGSQVILSDLSQATLDDCAAAISSEITTGKIIACIESDLSSREGCQALCDRVKVLDTPVDILINNAGIGLFGRMDEVPVDKWERLMQVNLMTPMRLSSLFMAEMIERRQGHIVNISSLAGWVAPGGMAHYCSSKFGLRGFSEGLFNELKPYNVKVTAVYPFFSKTPILQSESFGTLAEMRKGSLEDIATDPAKVMETTIKAIEKNKLHVFPDRMANSIYLLKQYLPKLYDLMSDRFPLN
ncbi:SDR family oxidoreductase [Waterburya agarophytonicola K14]|uniref:SDR family oxidoreductase n=1 Tax=Waterburya agarophytonicola KI4 TaxID=2874699 RepID=A0A964BPX9_9CYAN|nr:SDR family oxidoreductase [Waterburya agarophytonicola]MCC0176333.1 SDR family oxidoreductase [Waterburya agarophytonicola KI4]